MRVRDVLYYSSAGFFLLQLEQACSYLPSICSPDYQRGVSYRLGRQQSRRIGHRVDEPMVDRSAPHPAEVGILIGRIKSLIVKSTTIGIELTLTAHLKMGTDWPVNSPNRVSSPDSAHLRDCGWLVANNWPISLRCFSTAALESRARVRAALLFFSWFSYLSRGTSGPALRPIGD